jgi:hypothetical protein
MDVDQYLVACRLRLFDLADAQILGPGERVAEHCSLSLQQAAGGARLKNSTRVSGDR